MTSCSHLEAAHLGDALDDDAVDLQAERTAAEAIGFGWWHDELPPSRSGSFATRTTRSPPAASPLHDQESRRRGVRQVRRAGGTRPSRPRVEQPVSGALGIAGAGEEERAEGDDAERDQRQQPLPE